MLGLLGYHLALARDQMNTGSKSALLITALTEETKLHIDVNEVKKSKTIDELGMAYTYTLPGFIITESFLMGNTGPPKYGFTSGGTTITTDGQLARYAQHKLDTNTKQDLTKWGIK